MPSNASLPRTVYPAPSVCQSKYRVYVHVGMFFVPTGVDFEEKQYV